MTTICPNCLRPQGTLSSVTANGGAERKDTTTAATGGNITSYTITQSTCDKCGAIMLVGAA